MTQPLFIDPVVVGAGDDVDDAPPPRWFVLVALLLVGLAAYYLGSFLDGPPKSSRHTYESGVSVYEQARQP
ncbi:MAG TPA: hypothetical protein VFQ85_00680 [Mycobacteriales bacterium]|nr:hypothetical protein [Mycobacteriales bacterium]